MRFPGGFRAKFLEEFEIDRVRLVLVQDRSDGKTDVWLGGDEWETTEPGVRFTPDHGVLLPHEAAQAIALAANKYLGNEAPSQAEVKVLREVLEKEQKRVDTTLAVVLLPKTR